MNTPQLIENIDDIFDNIKTVESFLSETAREEDFTEMATYIKKGKNLLCYKQNGEYNFDIGIASVSESV